jgi:hypothetical protein
MVLTYAGRSDLHRPHWHTPEWFDDGEALFTVVCERGLEGRRRDGDEQSC